MTANNLLSGSLNICLTYYEIVTLAQQWHNACLTDQHHLKLPPWQKTKHYNYWAA